eukprot:TRINITY_DN5229_c0_g1_i1.p1 TRINITY_DN5229_c0_g1~~TRINITY_DN5229_c0_g1_i1.p1  ORF type:complete len:630 (+),score=149.91 TRINITY_DN5229_c0_g1_i1:49-1938(+)
MTDDLYECITQDNLAEFLGHEEVLQLYKNTNARVSAYLTKEDTISKLIAYIVVDPHNEETNEAIKKKQTEIKCACLLLCEEVGPIRTVLVDSTDLLMQIFTFLDKEPASLKDSMTVPLAISILISLLKTHNSKIIKFLCDNDLLSPMAKHIQNDYVFSFFIELTQLTQLTSDDIEMFAAYLIRVDFLSQLVTLYQQFVKEAKAADENSEDEEETESDTLVTLKNNPLDVISSIAEGVPFTVAFTTEMRPSPLLPMFKEESGIKSLAGLISGENGSPINVEVVLPIIISVLNWEANGTTRDTAVLSDLSEPLKTFALQFDFYNDLLFAAEAKPDEPLGFTKFRVIELFAVMFKCRHKCLLELFQQKRVIPSLLERYFFPHAWNNCLHFIVGGMVDVALQADEDFELEFLKQTDLINAIIKYGTTGNDEAQRFGFLGYLNNFTRQLEKQVQDDDEMDTDEESDEDEEVVKKSTVRKALKQFLNEKQEWVEFTSKRFVAIKKKEDTLLAGFDPKVQSHPSGMHDQYSSGISVSNDHDDDEDEDDDEEEEEGYSDEESEILLSFPEELEQLYEEEGAHGYYAGKLEERREQVHQELSIIALAPEEDDSPIPSLVSDDNADLFNFSLETLLAAK